MDFALSDEQQSIVDLAKTLFADKATHERVKQIERGGGPRFDRTLWSDVAKVGLLGTAVPVEHGGAGLGFLEVALIVEQMGRSAAPIPLLETLVLGALPIAEFGSAEQRKTWLPRVVAGDAVITAALMEDADGGAPLLAAARGAVPTTRARADGAAWRLSGSKSCVPAGEIADLVLVPAATGPDTVGVFLLEPQTPGVRIEPLSTTSGQPEAQVTLDDVRLGAAAVLGSATAGAPLVSWIAERAAAALACLALGVCEQALALTSDYTKTRKQFDQPIAMFQAVGQRLADAYVDTEAIRLTAWQAAWRISAGIPAAAEVAIAKFWAADAGQRVVHTAQHLHGGIGVDRDYPLHRYFLYAKQIELMLGGATAQLRSLGKMLAEGSV